VASKKKDKPKPTPEERDAAELVRQGREQGLSLTGPDGLLKQLTKMDLETALDQEMTEHLGHEKSGLVVNETGNVHSGTRAKRCSPRAPGKSASRSRRTGRHVRAADREEAAAAAFRGGRIVPSLHAKGLTTGEISAHFAKIYGASVSKEIVSRITDRSSRRI
jgi:transposase-like protein